MPALSSAFQTLDPSVMVPAVKKATALLGPPPKTTATPVRVPGVREAIPEDEPKEWKEGTTSSGDPLLQAIAQQGSALTALVAHLTSGVDAMADLSGSASSSQSASTRGVQRREKLQNELAGGTSNFFQLLLQQLHRRMFPSRPMPQTEEGFKNSGVSLLQYLERFGGYRHSRETGLTLWLLGYVTDAMIQEDYARAQEHLALTVAALEQSGIDGDFTLGYLVALVEDPPVTLFQDRSTSLHSQGRPFAPLLAPSHAAVALSYLKELEILNSKKKETQSTTTPKSTATADAPPSPKRRPRYPRKPKAAGGNPQ